jgi:[ribosomal protein S5]-alanine N-acetyltransferase
LYTNEEVRKYLGGTVEPAVVKAHFQQIITSPAAGTHLAARIKNTEEFIGLITLTPTPHHDGTSTEISYQLLPDWWGKGLARECVEAVVDYASQSLQLTELAAET